MSWCENEKQNQNKLSRISPAQAIRVRWLDLSLTVSLLLCTFSTFMLSYMSYSLSYVAGGGLRLNLKLWLKQCAPLETAHYFIFPEARGTLASPRLLRVQAPQDQNTIQDWKWWKRSLNYIKITCVWNEIVDNRCWTSKGSLTAVVKTGVGL